MPHDRRGRSQSGHSSVRVPQVPSSLLGTGLARWTVTSDFRQQPSCQRSYRGRVTSVSQSEESAIDTSQLSAAGISVLAAAAAVATSTSYILQPELSIVARDLGISVSVVALVSALPIVGYLLGLALLVPLADRVRSNRLICAQLTVLAVGLVISASATSPLVLGVGLFVSGLCASTGAQMSSLAGRYSPPSRQGRAVGTVTAGISIGIVVGRILGGLLSNWAGWRVMLVIVAAACVGLAVSASAALPSLAWRPQDSYASVVGSLPKLVRSNRHLRLSALAGSLWFFAFSLVWVGLSLALAMPPINLSPARIGLYSLAGLLGVIATRIAGAAADRHGSRRVILFGLALTAVCTLAMTDALRVPAVLVAGMAAFDAGLFSAQVANQSSVLRIDPTHPAQFNSAYMVVYFAGGSTGAAIGGSLVGFLGWPGVTFTATGAVVAAACLVLHNRHQG
jgi:predicted MFS family arabinose efflux permease